MSITSSRVAPGRVLDAHADGQAAGVQLFAQALLDALNLFGRGGLVGRGPALGQDVARRQWGAEYQRARRHMAGRGAVVESANALLLLSETAATSGAPISSSSAVVTPSSALTRWLARSWPC